MGFCLPLVGSGTVTSIRSITMSNGGRGNVGLHNWAWGRDSDLVLNRLTLLVGDLLGDHFAVNLLNVLASGDRHLLGSLLWGVGTDFLGHLTAVRLDGHLAGGLGNSLNLDSGNWVDSSDWGSMDSSSAIAMSIDSSAMGNSSAISSISTSVASLPFDDTNVPGWAADLGSGLLAIPLILNMLLLNLFSVALFLSPWDAVLGLDGLVGDGALGSGHSLGDGGRGMDGWGSNAMSNTSTISTIASLRGAIGDGGSQTGVSNKLVHSECELDTSHEE